MTESRMTSFGALFDLLRYATAFRARIWLASICSVFKKLFDIMPEIMIGMAIDVVVRQEQSFMADFGVIDPFHQILTLGVLTFIVWAGESLFEFFHLVLWRNLAQALQNEMRLDAYRHLQDLDMAYFEDRSTGNLVAILNDDVNQLERFLDGGANDLIQTAAALISVGAVFFYLSPSIAAMAFVPIPIVVLGAFWFQRRAQPLYASVREHVGALSARLANNITGIATIKSFTAEERELASLRSDSEAYMAANRKAIKVSSAFIPVIRMAILGGFMATLILGGYYTLNGKLNAGAYGILVFLTQRLLWPLTGLAATVDLFERAMASVRRILGLINTPARIRDHENVRSLDSVRGELKFDQVDFAYASGITVLKDINLSVAAGETVAIIGQTGSGKTTLMKLLLRYYQPTAGKITLDGIELGDIAIADLRRAIGLVSQDVFLFQGSVRDNITYGRPDATIDEVRAAAETAEAAGFIDRLPQGYDTMIGERGQKLSGGQRQRLSIARAILKNPAIMVLDEATSSVDNETEAAIQRSMQVIAEGRTTFVIAHRLSTIIEADCIYVLDKGRIVESGRHGELLGQDGVYAGLWRVQTGDI
jgi:ATP-binding cassette subfamily B protein